MKNKKISFLEIFNFRNGKKRNQKEGVYNIFGSSGIIGTSCVYNANENTSIIGRVGSYCGSVYFSKEKCYVTDNAIIAETKKNFDPFYAHHLLKTANLDFYKHGSGQPLINQEILKSISVTTISNNDQKFTSKLLYSISDKIEKNIKINESLDKIIKTLFKSWFMDFDPVKAKVEGKPKELSKKISVLFPDSFKESVLGKIPKGWKVFSLGELVKEVGGNIKKGTLTKDKPYVTTDMIDSNKLFLSSHLSSEKANTSLLSFKKGDFLFGAMRPYFHRVCISPYDGTTRSTCLVLNSRKKEFSLFALLLLSQKKTINYATSISTGSTIPYVKWKNALEDMLFVMPEKSLILEFSKIIEPIVKRFQNHIFNQGNLIELRDTLIPQLILGDLKIPDVKEFIEKVKF